MACCALLQKWHWQILEESSASVSACLPHVLFSGLFFLSFLFCSVSFIFILHLLTLSIHQSHSLCHLQDLFFCQNFSCLIFWFCPDFSLPLLSPLSFLVTVTAYVCSSAFTTFPSSFCYLPRWLLISLCSSFVKKNGVPFVWWRMCFESSKLTVCPWLPDLLPFVRLEQVWIGGNLFYLSILSSLFDLGLFIWICRADCH